MGERRARRVVVSAVTVMLAALMMRDASLAADAIKQGLSLCARTMIPSLFPFMVVSELIVRSDAGRWISRASAWLLRPLLGMSEAGCCAVTLGGLCGFPVGARTAAAYYRRGEMSAEEFGRVICFCNVPSAAYLIGAVGCSLYTNVAVGRALWWLSLGAALVVGLILRPRRHPAPKLSDIPSRRAVKGTEALPLADAIRGGADGMMNVCAAVLLFSAIGAVVGRYLVAFGVSKVWRAAVIGALELSTGAEVAAACKGETALLLGAAAVGWGGLSVHCQIASVCADCPFPVRRFALARLAQAVLCTLGMWGLIRLGAVECGAMQETMRPVLLWASGTLTKDASGVWCVIWGALFAAACLSRGICAWRNRYGKKARA